MGSRSDQLFHKRKIKAKYDYKRKSKFLSTRSRVLIVCEGEKTEPLYFKNLIKKFGLTATEVEVSGDSGSTPSSVVKFGKAKIKLDSDIDYLFFVFDKDTHTDYDDSLSSILDLQKLRKYKDMKIGAITSNPCFELWFLMHYEPFTKPMAAYRGKSLCANLISELKKKPGFNSYSKGQTDHFELLYDKLTIAKKNSAQVLNQSLKAGENKHHGNPSTFVHELVLTLEKLANDQNSERLQSSNFSI